LIGDEIMSGVGRTGKFLASHHYQAMPQIICLSKGISSGYAPLGAVLIDEDPKTGEIQLPTAAKIGDAGDPKSLLGRLAAGGVSARLPFLFAVYDQIDTHFIFYRGEASRSEGGGEKRLPSFRFVVFAEIPWERIADGAVRTMLERYVAEQDSDQFGIYVGGFKAGDVHGLS
jgi:hypothetical protein